MISIPVITKDSYLVKLETGCQAAEVSGYHLSHETAAEIGFEKITGLPDAIEDTRHIEDTADRWSVYGLQWAYSTKAGFVRVCVRKIEPPKEAKTAIPRRAFVAAIAAICASPVIAQELPARNPRVITLPSGIEFAVTRESESKLSIEKLNRRDEAVTVWLSFSE
jgi:hypothetical protein